VISPVKCKTRAYEPSPGPLPVATPARAAGLSRLIRADAWRRHPIGQGQVQRGALVEVFPFDRSVGLPR
jgi:hypothetical protein